MSELKVIDTYTVNVAIAEQLQSTTYYLDQPGVSALITTIYGSINSTSVEEGQEVVIATEDWFDNFIVELDLYGNLVLSSDSQELLDTYSIDEEGYLIITE